MTTIKSFFNHKMVLIISFKNHQAAQKYVWDKQEKGSEYGWHINQTEKVFEVFRTF